MARARRFFFLHLGTLIGVFTYFIVLGGAEFSVDGVRQAAATALVVHGVYMAVAAWAGYVKQLDIGFVVLLVAAWLASTLRLPLVGLFQAYSATLLFATFGTTVLLSLILSRPFTLFYVDHQVPRWQRELPGFLGANRALSGFWVLIFYTAAVLCALHPTDWHFTFLYPNLLVLLVGVPAGTWLPPLYLRFFPPGLPDRIEGLLLGMPWVFDAQAAAGARAEIQFHVTGSEAGDYWLRVADGKCTAEAGQAPAPGLRIFTPDTIWRQIVRGELDGPQALLQGLYRADGDLALLGNLPTWFPISR